LEHLVKNYQDNPNKTSGELKTLKLLEFNPMIDLVYLLTTDTEEGNQAGQYIRDFLIKKLNANENRVIHTPVPGLQVKDAARFLSEGALNLLSTIKRIKESNSPGHECIIISTGGFKSVFPVISDAGKIYQLNLKYVFESSNEVISLPPDRDKFYESLKELHHITLAKELIKARFDYTEFSSNCHPDRPVDTHRYTKRNIRENNTKYFVF
jgi:putative CRISPR-associated protein (TIGR02619 family)